MKRLLISIAAILCVAAALAAAWRAGHLRGERASGPLGSECYVWQRAWDEAVVTAVAGLPESFAGVAPLCAEISWNAAGQSSVARPALDFEALRASRRPVSAVQRIGPREPSQDAQVIVCSVARENVISTGLPRFTSIRGGTNPASVTATRTCCVPLLPDPPQPAMPHTARAIQK